MSTLKGSKISEVKAFKSNLKTSIGTQIENSGLVLILCVEGCAVLSINFKEYSFRKGDIAIIPIGMTLIPLQASSLFQAEIILDFDTSKIKNKASHRCNGDLRPF